jgi:hypothetical protein
MSNENNELTTEQLEGAQGGKAMDFLSPGSRVLGQASGEVLDISGGGSGQLADEDLVDLTGGKAIAHQTMDQNADVQIDIAAPGHPDGGAPGQADHVTDPPTLL